MNSDKVLVGVLFIAVLMIGIVTYNFVEEPITAKSTTQRSYRYTHVYRPMPRFSGGRFIGMY
jgi:peptidoglycan/LPS O-acetylase OafA/YrhL